MLAAAAPLGRASSHATRHVAIADADVQLGEPLPALPLDPFLAGVPEHL